MSRYCRSSISRGLGCATRHSGDNKLQESGERLRALADSGPVMIWSARPDKYCDYFNRSWLQYRGRSLGQEIGSGWIQGVNPEDLEHCLMVRDSGFERRCSFQAEYRLRRHDDAYHWVVEYAVPSFSRSGAFIGYVGSCIDIQDRKRAEQDLQEKNDALRRHNSELREFAYAASHDLQEPLRTIASSTQLLAMRNGNQRDAESDKLTRFIVAGVQRMQTLIQDLLDYSCVVQSSGLRLVEIDCNAALQQALFGCQAAIQESRAVVTHGPLPTVRADEVKLEQVLQNLVSNAVKYRRPQERPDIEVSVAGGPHEWLFQITDNGIGFDPRYSERIFELFKRLHNQDEYSGSGIGLAICRKIVERHGGRIWAESEPGQGSRFFFTLQRL